MFTIGYQKYKKPDLEMMAAQSPPNPLYQPFDLSAVQAFNPIYTRFFSMNENNYNIIALNHEFQAVDLWTVAAKDGSHKDARIFVKFSPLIDPIKFMTGRYKLSDPQTVALPCLDLSAVSQKIGEVNNCSYTDCFFSYLSNMLGETHGFIHSVPFYGSALAVQKTFRFNLEDDLDYVKDSEFFINSIGVHVTLDKTTEYLLNSELGNRDWSRAHRAKLQICDENLDEVICEDLPDIIDITKKEESNEDEEDEKEEEEEEEEEEEKEEEEEEEEEESEEKEKENKSINSLTDNNSSKTSENDDSSSLSSKSDSTGEKSSWETTSSSASSDPYDSTNSVYCYLKNFPVQLIFQEQCVGTFDDLLLYDDLDDDEVIAALMQIICTLYTYNHCFQFTHNDLHTSNIMYTETDCEYLYYKVKGQYYRVPTYGRIYKLIDFGRAIYSFQGKQFCSDSFALGGDAYSQYNCEPFLNSQKPRLEPNYSFDLCRLGCSLYDMLDSGERDSLLYKLVEKWCTDDEGKNILYKKTGQERYPDFKLYKMIARTVHAHTAKAQFDDPAFSQFLCDKEEIVDYYDLDALPKYA